MNARAVLAAAVLTVLLGSLALVWYVDRPEVVLLRDDGAANWIVHDSPVDLRAKPTGESIAIFRTFVEFDEPTRAAVLEFSALSAATIYLAGRELTAEPVEGDWSRVREFPIGEHLAAGRHELAIAVRNQDGPAALRARCDELELATGPDWEATLGEEWTPARLASDRPLPGPGAGVPSGMRALGGLAWVWLGVMVLAAGAVLTRWGSRIEWIAHPRHLQYLLLALWAALALNNFWRLPLEGGFDTASHLSYIRFIVERGALPLADDGWQMFQMPLFYLLAALPYRVLSVTLEGEATQYALRLMPLACGALQVLVGRRALAAAFPDREDLQSLGLVFIALVPMNLYMSQWVGNEPLAGLLTSLVLMQLVEVLREPERARHPRRQILIAASLAAAILAKITAVLVAPFVILVWLHAVRGRDGLVYAGRILIFLLLLVGWTFARNLVEFGTPFVFASSSVEWWQDPGYRVPEDLIRFGRALDRPVFASVGGFWNAIYSTFWLDGQMSSFVAVRWFPPWNLNFVLAGGWLGFPLALAMLAGGVRGVVSRRPVPLLAVACVAIYFLALMQQFLALPVYSTAKATYTLGLLPAYSILLMTGVEPMMRNRTARALIVGTITSWALFSYLGYFVV